MKISNNKKQLRIIILVLILIIAALLTMLLARSPKKNSQGDYEMKNDYIVEEKIEKSDTMPAKDIEMPKQLNKNGKTYKLLSSSSDITTEYSTPYLYETVSTDGNPPTELEVMYDNKPVKVYLRNSNEDDSRMYGKATGFTDFSLQISAPDVPKTKEMDYFNEKTSKTEKVTLNLDEVIVTTPARWVNDVAIPITFSRYGSDYYLLYGEKIQHNTEVPQLAGKEHLVLKMLNLDSRFYRLNKFEWRGGEYESNGEVKRNAIAYGSRYVKDYRANYSNNNIFLGRKLIYETKENILGNVFVQRTKGIYAPNYSTTLGIMLGAFLLLLFIVVVLYVIASKKNIDKGVEDKNGRI